MGAPYQPFVEPVEALVGLVASGILPDLGDPDRSSEHATVLRTLTDAGRTTQPDSAEPQFARQMFDACAEVVRSAALARPLVLVLEDLHWAGETALDLFRYLVQHTVDSRLLILATQRTTLPDRSADLVSTAGELYRLDGVRRIDLEGLAAEEITEFLVTRARVAERSAHDAAGVLRDQTGGNPFVLQEVLRGLAARGGLSVLRWADLHTPESVLETVRHRLDGLPVTHRRTLEAAAVIGEEFSLALLAAVMCEPSGDVDSSAASTFAGLDSAAAVGMIETGRDQVQTGRFPHSLARQAVLDLMTDYQRASLNARVATVIEQQFPAADLRIQRLAHHYSCAHLLGHGAKAVHYLVRAAHAAQSGLAHGEAARLFERAGALTDDPRQRDELRLDAARNLLRSGKLGRARELDELIITSSDGWLRLRASVGYEAASWRTGEPGERAVRLLSTALSGVPRDLRNPSYVRAIAALGRAHAFNGDLVGSAACDAQAVELARALNDDRLLATVLQVGLQNVLTPETLSESLQRAAELTALSEQVDELRHLAPAAYYRAAISYVVGRPDELDAAHADLRRSVRATGQPFWEWVDSCLSYGTAFIHADFVASMGALATAQELGRTFDGAGETDGPRGLQTYLVRRETGRLEPARRLISGEEDPATQWAPGLLALYCEFDLRAPAVRVLEHVMTQDLSRHERSSTWPAVLAFVCEATIWLERRETAEQLYPMVERYSGLNLLGGEFIAPFGSAERYLAGLASILGRAGAEASFEAALDMDRRMNAPLHLATSMAAYATHLRRTRDRSGRLVELTEQARTLATQYGLARVLRLLASLDGDGATPASLPGGLTPREADVLSLLGAGLSNKAISERLVISENTAANHVRSILLKTGARNRTQAAMYASERGLLGQAQPKEAPAIRTRREMTRPAEPGPTSP